MKENGADDPLLEVAELIARFPLQVANRQPGDREFGGLSKVLLPIRFLLSILRMIVGGVRGADDVGEAKERARQLYRSETGVDRDQANADLSLIEDRLVPLATSWVADASRLVCQAAIHLAHWTARGRPSDPMIERAERAFDQMMTLRESSRRDDDYATRFEELQIAYVDAWRDIIDASKGA